MDMGAIEWGDQIEHLKCLPLVTPWKRLRLKAASKGRQRLRSFTFEQTPKAWPMNIRYRDDLKRKCSFSIFKNYAGLYKAISTQVCNKL